MTKIERKQMLVNRYFAIFGVALAQGFVPTSRAEIVSEGKGLRKTYVSRTQDRAIETGADESEDTARESFDLFDSVKDTGERETDILLSLAERRQLAREKTGARSVVFKVNDLTPEKAFSDAEKIDIPAREVPDFVPAIDPRLEPSAFDLAMADLPLALNP